MLMDRAAHRPGRWRRAASPPAPPRRSAAEAQLSATLSCKGLAASFGARELFSGLDLEVAPGDVVGLVGPNGTGKSTLLRILAGLRPPDAGTVSVTPPIASLGYLAQEPERVPGESVRALLARRTGVTVAEAAMNEAAHAVSIHEPGADERYSVAFERWLALGAPTSRSVRTSWWRSWASRSTSTCP